MHEKEEGWEAASAEKGGREKCNECRKRGGGCGQRVQKSKREGGAERAHKREGKGDNECSKTRMDKGQQVQKTMQGGGKLGKLSY